MSKSNKKSKSNGVYNPAKESKHNNGNLLGKENTQSKENTPSKAEELAICEETIIPAMDLPSKVDDANVDQETKKTRKDAFYGMNGHVWLITALTNLHVGNESTSNYGIIDNAIQRDVLTDLPCINSSSLKGALNEFCCMDMDRDKRVRIFGSDKKGKGDEKDKEKGTSQKGKSIFFDAQLLFLPKQENTDLYSYVTSHLVLDLFEKKMNMFGFTMNDLKNKDKWDEVRVKARFGLDKSLKIMENAEFVECCNDENLPVIARNELKNGMSNNLWYEQVLPPQTRLCAITVDEDETLADAVDKEIIQIGANATIGYGYCRFSKIVVAKVKDEGGII